MFDLAQLLFTIVTSIIAAISAFVGDFLVGDLLRQFLLPLVGG